MKKVLSFLIAWVFILSSFITVGAIHTDIDIDTNKLESDIDIDASGLAVIPIKDAVGFYKTEGRTTLINSELMLDWTAASIEFNANCSGNVSVIFDVMSTNPNGCYFTIYIDGAEQARDFCVFKTTGVHLFQIASNLAEGIHSFKIVRQTEAEHADIGIAALCINGQLTNKPVDKKLSIEFVGDSITTAYGNIFQTGDTGDAADTVYQDATKGYAYLTAQKLNADYSIIARLGIGASVGYQPISMNTVYPLLRHSIDSNSPAYDFAKQPDIVVIALGTNDVGTYNNTQYSKEGVDTLEKVQQGFANMLTLVKEKNPNAKIIWMYNMMTDGANELINNVINDAGGSDEGYYACQVTKNNDGGAGHPSVAGHQKFAEELSDFISNEVFNKKIGDVDGNDNVNFKDAYQIAEYIAGYDSDILAINADVNEDKVIDLKDVVMTFRNIIE